MAHARDDKWNYQKNFKNSFTWQWNAFRLFSKNLLKQQWNFSFIYGESLNVVGDVLKTAVSRELQLIGHADNTRIN